MSHRSEAARAGNLRPDDPSAWCPLRHPLFRALFLSSIASNIGTSMQGVGAVWLMTSLSSSPLLVTLLQTSVSLPIFLLALPSGALADVVDRRRLLLVSQGWMLASAAGLAAVTLLNAITPWSLLLFTFLLGLGAALNRPAFQAVLPDLVERPELPAAVALGSAALNVARTVGPALGGLLVATAGPGCVFLLNAVSFVGLLLGFYCWQPPRQRALPAAGVLQALRAGLRYACQTRPLRAVLVRTGVFVLCGSALWALLPLLARRELQLGAIGYGLLLGCLGLGAVLGVVALPRLRQRISVKSLLAGGTVCFAVAAGLAGWIREGGILAALLVAAGAAWLLVIASLNAAVQTGTPSPVRGRALALYLMVLQGSMAAGCAFWGLVAWYAGIPLALFSSAAGLVAGLAVTACQPLPSDQKPGSSVDEGRTAGSLSPDPA